MKRGTLVFVQSSGNFFWDILERVCSGSGVVHCGVATGDGKMINARGTVCYSNEIEGTDLHGELPEEWIEPVISFMEQQLGKPYDYLHLVANPIWNLTRINIGCSAPRKWNCATLIAAAIRSVGKPDSRRVFTKPLATVTPQDILSDFPQA